MRCKNTRPAATYDVERKPNAVYSIASPFACDSTWGTRIAVSQTKRSFQRAFRGPGSEPHVVTATWIQHHYSSDTSPPSRSRRIRFGPRQLIQSGERIVKGFPSGSLIS